MLIGELSKRTGLSRDTIRFYEKKGLIRLSGGERAKNNYKDYPESVFDRLTLIKTIKALGFTLHEIDQFMKEWGETSASCNSLQYHLLDKMDRIDRQIKLLLSVKERLVISLEKCSSNSCEFERLAILANNSNN